MRKLLIGGLAAVLALAVAAVAIAETQQTYRQSFSQKRVKKSTGTTFTTDSNDPSNTSKNGQPKAVRVFDIKFPAGSAVDSKGAVECKASDNDMLTAGGKPACPKSVIGAGKARSRLPFAGFADVAATVTAFDAKKGLILYVDPSPTSQPFILRPKFKGNLKNGPTLSTKVPPLCIPPATAQNNACRNQSGQVQDEAILDHFDLKTLAKKKGKHVLIRTPKKCKGTWLFKAKLTYADGSKKTVKSLQPCKKK